MYWCMTIIRLMKRRFSMSLRTIYYPFVNKLFRVFPKPIGKYGRNKK